MRRTLVLVLALALAGAFTGGCQEVRKKAGLKTTVCGGSEGSMDGVVVEAVKAALEPDEEKGWEQFHGLLHSKELASPASESTWRTMKWPTFERKVHLYLEDDTKACVQFRYSEEIIGGGVKYFIQNEGNPDLPSPVKLEPDPAAGGAYRITFLP